MIDNFNRNISYLRVSVTDKCNLRCTYCMPEEGIPLLSHHNILSIEEIYQVIKVGAKLGIKKIRFTGGEPLVRKGIVTLVRIVKQINGIEEITMTTNGILLSKYAHELKSAGLDRVNISIDSLDPLKYNEITRTGKLDEAKKGIFAALKAGLVPVKINIVKLKQDDNQNIAQVKDFCNRLGLKYRTINQMNLESGEFSIVEGGEGGNCSICNRLRLTSNGNLKPCLFSNQSFNVREYGISKAFSLALKNKPQHGEISTEHAFYNIGG